MNTIGMLSYDNMTNEEIVSLTLKEMGTLKRLFKKGTFDEYRKRAYLVNLLIKEIKRRGLSIKTPALARRVLIKY